MCFPGAGPAADPVSDPGADPVADPMGTALTVTVTAPVAQWLEELAGLLATEPGVIGVRLLGSMARGEEAGAWVDGSWQCFSDIELLVVTRGRMVAARRADLTRRASSLAAGWGQRSPLFHVDLLLRERSRLKSLPPFIFTHELREAGRTLAGPELRPEIRAVGMANLDRRNTREILFKRLWHLAEALPADWLRGRPLGELAARGLAVGLARQSLDLPTALLPEIGVLAAGYAARQAAWRAADPPFAPLLAEWLGSDPSVYLLDCLERRRRGEPSVDPGAGYRGAVAVLAGGLSWLADRDEPADCREPADRDLLLAAATAGAATAITADGEGDPSGDPLLGRLDLLAARLPALSHRLFNERAVTPGERLALARQSVRLAYTLGPAGAWRWWRAPRKGHLAAGLLRLHAAGLALLAGRAADAAAFLAAARVDLARAHGDWSPAAAPALPADAVDAWLAVRREAGRAFWRVARLGAPGSWRDLEARLR